MKSVISADSRHHNRFRRYALRSMPQPVRRVWDLDRIGIGITRTPAMLADPIDDAPSVIPRLNVGQRKGSDLGSGRKPQPRSMASIARSGSPFLVMLSGALGAACRSDRRFSTRTPLLFPRFTRPMRAARFPVPAARCQPPRPPPCAPPRSALWTRSRAHGPPERPAMRLRWPW